MAVIVYIIDLSGFIEWFRPRIKWGRFNLSDEKYNKPFFCSRCLTFWAGGALALIEWSFKPFLWGCLFSWYSYYFSLKINIIQDLIVYLYNYLSERLNL